MFKNEKKRQDNVETKLIETPVIKTVDEDLLAAVIGGMADGPIDPGGGNGFHCGRSTSSMLNMEFFIAIADESWDGDADPDDIVIDGAEETPAAAAA